MKLSKAQQKVMDHLKEQIDYARNNDYMHFFAKCISYPLEKNYDEIPNPHLTNEGVLKQVKESMELEKYAFLKDAYEERLNGIALVTCNSRTLYKLVEYGLIEIVKDSNGESYGIDKVKVLNY